MDVASSMTSLPAAFVAGAVTSIHCAGMCGPLSCALANATARGRREALASTALYHAARAASYALLGGALAGRLPLLRAVTIAAALR